MPFELFIFCYKVYLDIISTVCHAKFALNFSDLKNLSPYRLYYISAHTFINRFFRIMMTYS